MPREIFPGQHKFHIIGDDEKKAKRNADSRRRMAKLRQNRSEQTTKDKQRQQQYNKDFMIEQIISGQAAERYLPNLVDFGLFIDFNT
jgi:hypothetical protein